MTPKGKKLFDKVEPLYSKQVRQLMAVLNEPEQKALVKALGKIRKELS
jgi:DNA-binding MarR family transcriptional regulator